MAFLLVTITFMISEINIVISDIVTFIFLVAIPVVIFKYWK